MPGGVHENTKRECNERIYKELLDLTFEGKMSETDYTHYQFYKGLSNMYFEGLDAGRRPRPVLSDTQRFLTFEKPG